MCLATGGMTQVNQTTPDNAQQQKKTQNFTINYKLWIRFNKNHCYEFTHLRQGCGSG